MATNFSLTGEATTTSDRQFNAARFFSFRYLVTVNLMKVIYFIGMAIITLFGLFTIFSGFVALSQGQSGMFGSAVVAAGFWSMIGGGLWLVFGNLFWRIACETWVVLFSMHEIMGSIEKLLQRNSGTTAPIALNGSPIAAPPAGFQPYTPSPYEVQAPVPTSPPAPAVSTPASSLSGHVCRNCGGWVKGGVKFCGSCGTVA